MTNEKRARAGEGGGLPKGLSLFRFILFSFLMAGAIYGGAALYFDPVPRPGDTPPAGVPSAQWKPNPLWLPSFVTIRAGIGVSHSPQGYVFNGRAGYALFGSATILCGMLILGAAGWIAGELIRREAVRRRYAP